MKNKDYSNSLETVLENMIKVMVDSQKQKDENDIIHENNNESDSSSLKNEHGDNRDDNLKNQTDSNNNSNNSTTDRKKDSKSNKNKDDKFSSLTLEDIYRRKSIQNLEERTKLLDILRHLFKIQLYFMNIMISIIIVAVFIDIPFFRDVNIEILSNVTSFMKYFISAILTEILAGIIYIVHKVYTQK